MAVSITDIAICDRLAAASGTARASVARISARMAAMTDLRGKKTVAGSTGRACGRQSARELERLAVERGERIVRRLPGSLTVPLTAAARRDLARAFGKPALRQARGGAV